MDKKDIIKKTPMFNDDLGDLIEHLMNVMRYLSIGKHDSEKLRKRSTFSMHITCNDRRCKLMINRGNECHEIDYPSVNKGTPKDEAISRSPSCDINEPYIPSCHY